MVAYIQQRNTRSSVPLINLSMLRSLPLPLAPIDEQSAIARALGTVDDKIELNRKMNETLAGIARALFQSWFVDFDPFRVKAEGKQPSSPEPIDALYPNALEPSAIGDIPAGWQEPGNPSAANVYRPEKCRVTSDNLVSAGCNHRLERVVKLARSKTYARGQLKRPRPAGTEHLRDSTRRLTKSWS
jgi:hypothetical protein